MNVRETLLFYRKKNNMKQKELLSKKYDTSSYSRIENGKRAIHIDMLEKLLDKLSVSNEEFFRLASFNDKQEVFRSLYFYCASHLNDQVKKQKLLKYYLYLCHKKKNLRELSNYISISNYFSQYWTEVSELKENEIEDVYQYLIKKKYYQQFDYIIISNMIYLFKDQYQEKLIRLAFPIVDEGLRDEVTKKYAHNIMINYISIQLYRKNYTLASKYLLIAKKENENNCDYRYRLHIQYLSNLLNYIKTGDYCYLNDIHGFVNMLNDIGDIEHSQLIQKEIKYILSENSSFFSKESYPVGLFSR